MPITTPTTTTKYTVDDMRELWQMSEEKIVNTLYDIYDCYLDQLDYIDHDDAMYPDTDDLTYTEDQYYDTEKVAGIMQAIELLTELYENNWSHR